MCTCYSYNADWPPKDAPDTAPTVVLEVPGEDRTVCVDACIADVVRTLMQEGFAFSGSCCGHNLNPPSLILASDNDSGVTIALLRSRLEQLDPRPWTILRWELRAYPANGEPYTESL